MPGRPFKKGQSGNPGGRRVVPPDVKAIFAAALPEVAAKLVETALDREHDDHVKAAAIVIERVLGKVAQPLTGANGSPLFGVARNLSDDELMEKASEIIRLRTGAKAARA